MAPKAENKQGRFISRVVIIFPSQIAELSICSIMRVRTFCGDNSPKDDNFVPFAHRNRSIACFGGEHAWFHCWCIFAIFFVVYLMIRAKRNFFLWGYRLSFEEKRWPVFFNFTGKTNPSNKAGAAAKAVLKGAGVRWSPNHAKNICFDLKLKKWEC